MTIIYVSCGVNNIMKEDHRSYKATFAVVKRKPKKNSGLYGIRTLDLFDTGAALYQLHVC